jgi:hypothetical protein
MYRITDERHTNAIIAAMQRGIPCGSSATPRSTGSRTSSGSRTTSIGCGPRACRCASRHLGLNHQKLVLFYNNQPTTGAGPLRLRLVELDDAVGEPAAGAQLLHDQAWMYQWFIDQFESQVEQPGAQRRD